MQPAATPRRITAQWATRKHHRQLREHQHRLIGALHDSPSHSTVTHAHSTVTHEENIYASADDYYDSASAIYAQCSSSAIRTHKAAKMSSLESKSSTTSPTSTSSGRGGRGEGGADNTTLSSVGSSTKSQSCISPCTRQRLVASEGHSSNTSDDDSGCAILEEYVWVPNGLKPRDVNRYFAALPDTKVAYVNSVGEKWRMRQLLVQLPPQDTDSKYCRQLSKEESSELKRWAALRKNNQLGRAIVRTMNERETGDCANCCHPILHGELYVTMSGRHHISNTSSPVFHPACFTCSTCVELLVDLIYFVGDDGARVFCGRHHAELTKPRCHGCDEIIFSDECTEAEGKNWHMTHFACLHCNAQLGGQRYVMKDSRAYCVECYHTHCADRCSGCACAISVDQAHVTHGNRQWHASTDCFACTTCAAPLLGRPFIPKTRGIFCSIPCVQTPAHLHKRRLLVGCEAEGGQSTDVVNYRMVQPDVGSIPPHVRPDALSPAVPPLRLSASVENIYECVPSTNYGRTSMSTSVTTGNEKRRSRHTPHHRRHQSSDAARRSSTNEQSPSSSTSSNQARGGNSNRVSVDRPTRRGCQKKSRAACSAKHAGHRGTKHVTIDTDKNTFLESPVGGPVYANYIVNDADTGCSTCSSDSDSDEGDYEEFLAGYYETMSMAQERAKGKRKGKANVFGGPRSASSSSYTFNSGRAKPNNCIVS